MIRASSSSLLVLITFFLTNNLGAQLSAPQVESVYGGRVNAITGYALNADTSRIFIATESANSIFYADVHATGSPPVFGKFTVLPGVDATAGYGANIRHLAVHDSSGTVFFIHDSGLLSTHPAATTVTTVQAGTFSALLIKESTLFFVTGGQFYFGTLDNAGVFTNGSGSPVSVAGLGGQMTLWIHPLDSTVCVFTEGNTPTLYNSGEPYDQIDHATVFSDISPSTLDPANQWRAFGIAPDGRFFIAGSDHAGKHVAYSDDLVTWSSYSTGMSGISADNLAFSGDSLSYHVYFAKGYNTNNGLSGSWSEFGQPGGWETHPNDGAVFADPLNPAIVYMTTDQGIGASYDHGASIFEIDDGVEAVQVRGFDMSEDKNVGWLASKSGIRKVSNYQSSPSWTNAIFPNSDGSPYYSVEMVPGDTSSVYVGNVRVYKTHNDGNHWMQVLTPEQAPYNFPNVGTKALAIEVCEYDSNIVFAGFEIQGPDHGGLFYSTDAGASWDQMLLEASSTGQDVDVFDIVFNLEGSDTVAYVGVEYDLDSPQGRSVYKLTKSGGVWSAAQDMNGSTTSTGSVIVVTIRDIEVSTSGDTIFACGTDAGINHPVAYFKPLTATGLWTPFTTSGFPTGGKEAMAITIGKDTVYCAVDHEIYVYPVSASSWMLGYAYPVGQRINFLYFDDLLVGTETGLYGHLGTGGVTNVDASNPAVPGNLVLHQNYPNPFNPSTVITYKLSADSRVTLSVYNLLGEQVATLVDEFRPAGAHALRFDASGLPNGVYFYTISAGQFKATRKMLLVR